jgi:hypothetical protein
MYNMDISILGLKFNVEILILIGVIYLILVGHTVGGCCNFRGPREGMQNGPVGKVKNNNGNGDNMAQVGPSSTSNPVIAKEVAGAIREKEGFVGANTNYGGSAPYSLSSNSQTNIPSSWVGKSLTVTPGKPLNSAVRNILNRPSQPVPLPEGEMFMFANTEFKPECCPNTYSSSTGCACMTTGQYNYLVLRGGNNVPYAEY